nr:hypothetical protein [Tanacetum cinerariifolium]
GIDLAHWLREQDIPFVFLSANLTDSVLEEAKVTEPYGFLNKPFREKDVLSTLEIARYRHAHSAEAKLRQQQEIQMAVNNALVTLHDRDQLEEIEARRQLKAAELAIVRAFQNGKNVAETTSQVAAAIHELMPVDILSIYWAGQAMDSAFADATVVRQGSVFKPLGADKLALPAEADSPEWQQAWAELPGLLRRPTLHVGEQQELQERNVAARHFGNQLGIKSAMHVPIALKGAATAALLVASSVAFAYSERDLCTLRG